MLASIIEHPYLAVAITVPAIIKDDVSPYCTVPYRTDNQKCIKDNRTVYKTYTVLGDLVVD